MSVICLRHCAFRRAPRAGRVLQLAAHTRGPCPATETLGQSTKALLIEERSRTCQMVVNAVAASLAPLRVNAISPT